MSSPTPVARPAPAPRSRWDAWGDETAALPAGARAIVSALLPGKAHPVPRLPRPVLTASRLSDDDLARLAAVIGAAAVTPRR